MLGKSERLVAELCALWAAHEKAPAEIEVIFVDEPAIQALHYDYLHDASSTDIITFDLGTSPEGARVAALYICPEVAQRFAARYKATPRQELQRLIAHGILHLLGYDDHSPQDKRRMRAAENKILARL
jgi:probable rRNA maturation factor